MKSQDWQTLHSTGKDDWETPASVFDPLHREFAFTLDVAASPANAKVETFISKDVDALRLPWSGRCWMNPPYSRDVGVWVKRAFDQVYDCNAGLVVALLYARTDTRWWHEYVMCSTEVRLIKGRIRFVGAPAPAPAPSCIVVFSPPLPARPVFSSWRAGRD